MRVALLYDGRKWDADLTASIALLGKLGAARTAVAVACALKHCGGMSAEEAFEEALGMLFPGDAPLPQMLREKAREEVEAVGGAERALSELCPHVASALARIARPTTRADAVNALNALLPEDAEKVMAVNADCLSFLAGLSKHRHVFDKPGKIHNGCFDIIPDSPQEQREGRFVESSKASIRRDADV